MNDFIIDKDKILEFMHTKNITTQTQLAEMMGITKNQLSLILSSKFNPVKSNAIEICNLLGISLMDVIQETKENYLIDDNEDLPVDKNVSDYIDISHIKPLRPYTEVELFAGAGGLALGLEKAGFEALGLVEIDKFCCNTLRNNRPNWNVIENDIIKISQEGIHHYIPEVNEPGFELDLLSGGYPCQSFSYSGKKLGLEDVRGTMFYYFADILRQLKPKMFVAENVKGLVSHDDGKTLQTMIDVFEEVGYVIPKPKVLNAMNYGVSQKRQRIIIVGIRKDLYEGNVEYKYPKPSDDIRTLRHALANVQPSDGARYPESKKKVLELIPPGGYWRDLPDEIARQYMGKSYYSGGGRTGMARRISWDEPCLTLTCSPAQKQTERCHPDETRPFTVAEYAAIQSFSEDWVFSGSIAQQYKQIGNAVAVNFAKAVGLSIINTLNLIHSK